MKLYYIILDNIYFIKLIYHNFVKIISTYDLFKTFLFLKINFLINIKFKKNRYNFVHNFESIIICVCLFHKWFHQYDWFTEKIQSTVLQFYTCIFIHRTRKFFGTPTRYKCDFNSILLKEKFEGKVVDIKEQKERNIPIVDGGERSGELQRI